MLGREPAIWLAAINAVIALAIGFGLNVTPTQFALIMTASTALIGLITRQLVAPKDDVEAARILPSSATPEAINSKGDELRSQ